MVRAIAECHRVDEVKEIHNKARALEIYAKQAMNVDAERKATDIRLRAERRAGELLAKMEKKPGKRNDKPAAKAAAGSEYREALKSAGMNERTARRWQELASVPKKQFEDALRDTGRKPTTNGIITASKPVPKMDDDALWLWGRLRDFERMEIQKRRAKELVGSMTDTMRHDLCRITPVTIEFLGEILEAANEQNTKA